MSEDLPGRLRAWANSPSDLVSPERELLDAAADEIERMHEAMDNIGEDGDEVAWRDRDGDVEFMSSKEWIICASNELKRLRDIIDDYARVCAMSEAEIRRLTEMTGGVTKPMPESSES